MQTRYSRSVPGTVLSCPFYGVTPAGFVLIEARDLNEAIRLAEKIPLAAIGSIEIRPVMHMRAAD